MNVRSSSSLYLAFGMGSSFRLYVGKIPAFSCCLYALHHLLFYVSCEYPPRMPPKPLLLHVYFIPCSVVAAVFSLVVLCLTSNLLLHAHTVLPLFSPNGVFKALSNETFAAYVLISLIWFSFAVNLMIYFL